MPDASTYPFYEAYVTNVQHFLLAEKDIRRMINRALKTGKPITEGVQTKIYALLYSTYAEASFMKMILTPYGFEQGYVDQILAEESIQQKWLKCLTLAFNKFTAFAKGSEVPNKQLELKRIIQVYVVDPSVLRNKIAHGQLSVALNSKNTALNPLLTTTLDQLDFVTIYRWFKINQLLTGIIEDLIESPDQAHYNYYHSKFQQLEAFIHKSAAWTTTSKLQTPSMRKKVQRNP